MNPSFETFHPPTPEHKDASTKRLESLSRRNIQRELEDFIGNAIEKGIYNNPDEAHDTIMQNAAEIKDTHALTVNMSPESVARLINAGKMETFWDHMSELGDYQALAGTPTANNKAVSADYVHMRQSAEDGLRQFVDTQHSTKSPIYAALASTDDNMKTGAAPAYGNWNIIIEPKNIEQNTVYSYTDSFIATGDNMVEFNDRHILSPDDAYIGKAIHAHDSAMLDKNLRYLPTDSTEGYVEAAIFDDINLEHISSIVGNIKSTDDLVSLAKIMPQLETAQNKVVLSMSDKTPLLTKDYLRQKFKVLDDSNESTSSPWEELGLQRTDDIEMINSALTQKINELWKSISRQFPYKNATSGRHHLEQTRFRNSAQMTKLGQDAQQKLQKQRSYISDPSNEQQSHDWMSYHKILDLRETQAFFEAFANDKAAVR